MTDEIIGRFAEAIAHAEGFYQAGSLPQRCHNPGDLAIGDRGFGTALSTGIGAANITIFDTDASGWLYLNNQVRRMLNGSSRVYSLSMSLLQVGLIYAVDEQWGRNVAAKLGVPPETTLGELAAL